TRTPTPTLTRTATPVVTPTRTATPIATPTRTATPVATATPTPIRTPTPTPTAGGSGLPPPWVDQDIGAPPLAGSAAFAGRVFTEKGSGADIWGASDQFHYIYQPVTGDVTIYAKVTAQGNTSPWAKAGVMIRETANANSAFAMMAVTPSMGLAFQYRT